MKMKVLLSKHFGIVLIFCIFLCSGLLFTLIYTITSNAAENRVTAPYELVHAKQTLIPLSSSPHKEKRVIKGMLITEASTYQDFAQIASELQQRYQNQGLHEMTLSIHNKNNGQYEEDLPYEPIRKGTISIIYTSPTTANINIHMP